MVQKRESRRVPFRKRIRLGKESPTLMAYTSDISEGGLRVESRNVYPIGTKVVISFSEDKVPGGRNSEIRVAGIVSWSSRGLGGLSGSMGLRFAENTDERIKQIYRERLNKLAK